jgi:hypothetical protein
MEEDWYRSWRGSTRALAENTSLVERNRTIGTDAAIDEVLCPLRVKSGHHKPFNPCPLYPRKRTSFSAAAMSVLCRLGSIFGTPI